MQKSALVLSSVMAIALSLGGCFGGEDADDNPVDPQDTSKISGNKLKPGLYVGDYSPYDTAGRWESEFTLSQDGAYRFFWVIDNEPIGDIQGSWFQRDSSLHFTGIKESYMDQGSGLFLPGEGVEDDTNSVRNVTDSSFVRREWTLLRQKPYWVTYRKKNYRTLSNGTFQYSRDIQIDSSTNLTVKIKISLDGAGFLYSYNEDTVESFQAAATWFQVGTIFGTEQNRARSFIDSSKTFTPWDTIPGALLQRIKDVSDTAFQMWTPGGFLSNGSWDVYQKL